MKEDRQAAPTMAEQTGQPAFEVQELVPEVDTGAPQAPQNPNLRWYVVHTYSGHENRAKKSLEERIRMAKMADKFHQILVPTENVVEVGKGGQKRTSRRKFFPGYMLVQMELDDRTWHLVKGTPKITGFVGVATRPEPVPDVEVHRLTRQIDEGITKPTPRVKFEDGETVRVVGGPFQNFNGIVAGVNPDKAKVRVMISILGRPSPVEVHLFEVEKA